MKDIIKQIGTALVEASEQSEFTAQRSIIEDLFPYIYLASLRMSSRAISRWLASEQNIKLSDVAIARALRKAEQHWKTIVQTIEPAARRFADAHDVDAVDILKDQSLFEHLESQPPILDGSPDEQYDLYTGAASFLRNKWFGYPDQVRAQCWRHLGIIGGISNKNKGDDNEDE